MLKLLKRAALMAWKTLAFAAKIYPILKAAVEVWQEFHPPQPAPAGAS